MGVFASSFDAESVIDELEEKGFNPRDISVIVEDGIQMDERVGRKGGTASAGAATGAATGGIIGGLAGLLVGVGAVAVPGIGGFLVGGPIALALGLTGAAATTVTGATVGLMAGGIVGGLIGLGVPERDAREYERRVRKGDILLAVSTTSERDARYIRDTFSDFGAEAVRITGESRM